MTSPGAILRRERDLGTPLGQETAEVLRSGGLVSDKIIIELIEDWLRLHGGHGFVFDGFPRTLPQAESLMSMLTKLRTALDLAIWLEAKLGIHLFFDSIRGLDVAGAVPRLV